MDWTLEVISIPVSDVDRAKAFYADQLGFRVDHDTQPSETFRIVQLTPPGSGCSIVVGKGVLDTEPGSVKGLQLVVADVHKARAELLERGVEVGEVMVAGPEGFRPAQTGDVELDNVGFLMFDDPDGNAWSVQQISAPLASRS